MSQGDRVVDFTQKSTYPHLPISNTTSLFPASPMRLDSFSWSMCHPVSPRYTRNSLSDWTRRVSDFGTPEAVRLPRPTSNCGLKRAMSEPSFWRKYPMYGSTSLRDIKETSVTIVRNLSGVVQVRISTCSRECTRGSARSVGWS